MKKDMKIRMIKEEEHAYVDASAKDHTRLRARERESRGQIPAKNLKNSFTTLMMEVGSKESDYSRLRPFGLGWLLWRWWWQVLGWSLRWWRMRTE